MVLAEAFAQGRPALVQRRCSVLLGHARRSNGALPYAGFAEFEAALDRLVGDPVLVEAMGRNGRRYVEQTYTWDLVLDRYEALLGRVAASA
jgi:glycosyltransferase involved in cell wall biosynthesis